MSAKQARTAVHTAAGQGLARAADHLLEVANRTVPVESLDLQRSGKADVDSDRLDAVVSYGRGPSAAYAVHMHEDMNRRHDPGRTAKWLENAMQSERDEALRLIAVDLRQVFGA